MRRQYKRKSAVKMSGGKKILVAFLSVILLVALFFLSFWVTTLVLRSNREPMLPQQDGIVASPTPKPTYEELEQIVIEKDEEIKRLTEQLERYRGESSTEASATPTPPIVTEQPKATQTPTPAPVKTATPVPTKAPTKAPTPEPTQEPTETPVKTPSVPITAPGAAAPTE